VIVIHTKQNKKKHHQKKTSPKKMSICEMLQKSTVTNEGRNDHCLQLFTRDFFQMEQPKTAVSFGCSSGFEVESLLHVFPSLEKVIGVDIDAQKLVAATQKFATNSKATIMHSTEFQALKQSFDIITVFNVLCNFYSGANRKPLPFSQFEFAMQQLMQRLNPHGVLCCYGTNYCVTTLTLPPFLRLHKIKVTSGPVPMFNLDGTPIPRDNDHVFAIVNNTTPHPLSLVQTQPADLFQISGSFQDLSVVRPTITFGILKPGPKSHNMGDYIQTLAAFNILSVFYTRAKFTCSDTMHRVLSHFAKSKPQNNLVRNTNFAANVNVIWVDRDNTSLALGERMDPVHIIANGWFMHALEVSATTTTPTSAPTTVSNKVFDFPFANCVRPIFVSVHIAHPEIMLDAKVVEYFKHYEPIGCRDEDTEKLMQSHGIKAYFSSCLTTTLEMAHNGGKEEKNIELDYGSCNMSHFAKEDIKSADEAVEMALASLQMYVSSSSLKSSRIHCLLPTRACSSKPECIFGSKTGDQSASWMGRSRFSGLVRVMQHPMERELRAMCLFEHVVEKVHDILFQSKVQQTEREVCDISALDTQPNGDEYFKHVRLLHPSALQLPRFSPIHAILQTCPLVHFEEKDEHVVVCHLRKNAYMPFALKLDIFVTFDQGYLKVFQVFLQHLSHSNSTTLLRVWCATRGVSKETFLKDLLVPFNVCLFQMPLDDKISFQNYKSPLTHVSSVCMDRVLVEFLEFADDVDRIIYLDLDIAVIGDLKGLLQLDSGPKGIIAKSSIKKDIINKWLKKYPSSNALHYPFQKSFNAGVMVMDVSKLRANKMFDNFAKPLYTQFGINDQMILNFYCKAQYKELPGKYNVFVGQDHAAYSLMQGLDVRSATCLHYCGSQKPWLVANREDYVCGWELHDVWHKTYESQLAYKHIPG
jgi:lipopolysaccharide biosynthesis glycosyltransferase